MLITNTVRALGAFHAHNRRLLLNLTFPSTYEKYNLSAADFTVSTQNHVLFRSLNMQKDPVMKEYSVNVTSDTLVLTFTPSGNSTAFVNAIEVVSVPDDLIVDDGFALDPSVTSSGLVTQALETVWIALLH